MSGAKYNSGRRNRKYHSKRRTRKPKKSKVRLIKSRKHYKNKRKTHRKRKGGGEPESIEMTNLTNNKLRETLTKRREAEEERKDAEEERRKAENATRSAVYKRIAAEEEKREVNEIMQDEYHNKKMNKTLQRLRSKGVRRI
jgi:hypothetical protein